MARVTVEDCIRRIPNRFELVLVAAQRGREITAGANLTVDRDNDKNPVVALREIADGTISVELLRTQVIQGMQKHVEIDEPEEEEMENLKSDMEMLIDSGDVDEMRMEDEIAEDGLTLLEDSSTLENEVEAAEEEDDIEDE